MNEKIIMKMALVISVIALSVSAITCYCSLENDKNDGYIEKYTLYFGLDESNNDMADEIEKGIIDIITLDYNAGYTNYRASGGYLNGSDVIRNDITLVFIITYIGEDSLHSVVNDAKERFSLGAVLIEKQYAHENLII